MTDTVMMWGIGIVALIIGFFIWSMMTDKDTKVFTTVTSTSSIQTASDREATFEAERRAEADRQVAFTVDVSKLPTAQQVALQAMGITSTSTISITNKMVSCAGVDMSATRMAEIKSGANVTAAEGVTFMACYKAND